MSAADDAHDDAGNALTASNRPPEPSGENTGSDSSRSRAGGPNEVPGDEDGGRHRDSAFMATSKASPFASERGGSNAAAGEEGGEAFDAAKRQKYSKSFLQKRYVDTLPDHLVPLAHEIHQLDEADLVLIADIAETEAMKGVYSLLPYTGSNWFLPSIRECEEGERHWGLGYSWRDGLLVFIGGRRLHIRILNIGVRVVFLVLCWFLLWNMLPHWLVEPGGWVWDPLVLIVVSAVVGGFVCRVLQIPPLVGVLWMGILWNNIPTLHYLTGGVVKHVFDISAKLGLTVILARAGYSLSIKGILPHWKQSLMLATLPFAVEGVVHSLIADKLFKYNGEYNWAFLQGMLCSVVSPAVVVPGTLYLQEMGYGKGVGPLSLMLSAVGIEIVVGVWCANFILGLLFDEQKLAVAIVLGPVQFAGGVLLGIAIGYLYYYVVELLKSEAKRLPNGRYEREHFRSSMDFAFAILLFLCFTMVFFGYRVRLAGGGCVMCVFFAATVSHLWLKDGSKEREEQKRYVGSWLAVTWDQVMLPVLFATMGAKIDISAVFNAEFFPKAVVCLVCSTAVRAAVILCVQLGDGMPWKEKLLVCIGYLGKASAQASIGPIAANLVADMVAKLPDSEKGSLDTIIRYANNVQQMSAMYVMFMAPIASLGLVRGGTVVLTREKQPSREAREARRRTPTSAHDSRNDGNGESRASNGMPSGSVVDEERREEEMTPMEPSDEGPTGGREAASHPVARERAVRDSTEDRGGGGPAPPRQRGKKEEEPLSGGG